MSLYQRFTKTAIATFLLIRARDPFGNSEQVLDSQEVASALGCSASSVRRAIADLSDGGLISLGRAFRRVGHAATFPRRLVAQKRARAIVPAQPAPIPIAPAQNCALDTVNPPAQAVSEPARLIKDPDPQTRESAEVDKFADRKYIQWLLSKARLLDRPPQLISQWVAKQLLNPLNHADYLGDTEKAIALLGGSSPAAVPPNNLEATTMDAPILRIIPGGQAPAISPAEHLARLNAKWITQRSFVQRALIKRQIEANPDWGLVCDLITGPAIAPLPTPSDDEVAF